MESKICTKCKIEKTLDNFCKGGKRSKLGLASRCRDCKKIEKKEWEKRNISWTKSYDYNYKSKNRLTINQKAIIYYHKNKESISIRKKLYDKKNRKKISIQQNIYVKNKLLTDPIYKLRHSLRVRIGGYLKTTKFKKNNATERLLGCPIETVKKYIERKFIKGMNWSNHGKGNGKWHIDHVRPLASAKTEEELIRLCHYTNLQPLWAIDNLKKGSKILSTQMTLTI